MNDGLIANPKQDALSASGQPHVRIGIVTYDGPTQRMERLDLTLEELRALLDGRPTAARVRLRAALHAADQRIAATRRSEA